MTGKATREQDTATKRKETGTRFKDIVKKTLIGIFYTLFHQTRQEKDSHVPPVPCIPLPTVRPSRDDQSNQTHPLKNSSPRRRPKELDSDVQLPRPNNPHTRLRPSDDYHESSLSFRRPAIPPSFLPRAPLRSWIVSAPKLLKQPRSPEARFFVLVDSQSQVPSTRKEKS